MKYLVKSEEEHLLASKRRIVKAKSFYNKDFSNSYKAWVKRKTRIHFLKNREDVMKVIDKLFENAAQALLDRDGGVVLEGIGYFAFYMPMYRRFKPQIFGRNKIARPFYETEYYNFFPYMFTDVFNVNRLKGWTMEFGFYKRFTEAYKKNRRMRKLYYKEVCTIYKTARK